MYITKDNTKFINIFATKKNIMKFQSNFINIL